MHSGPAGFSTIPWDLLVALHPQFALGVLCDCPVHVVARPIQIQFSSTAAPAVPVPGSFSSVMSTYAIFAGCDITIDPTSAFLPSGSPATANPLKSLSDFFQGLVTGITCTVIADSKDVTRFAPISDPTPLQLLPSALNRGAGMWALKNPENLKVLASIGASPPAAPLTVWFTFSFLTLAGGENYVTGTSKKTARECLKAMGYGGGDPCKSGAPSMPAPSPNY